MSSKYLLSLFIFIIFSSELYAKTYDSWRLLYGNTFGTIRHVKDSDKKYEVIAFNSKSSRDTYISGAKSGKRAWNNKKDKLIQWEMKFKESFVIIIGINTVDGYRNLIYTSGNEGGDLYFGLGALTIDGQWQTIKRNLEEDLHKYEPNTEVVSINAFIVRGSGRIGKIETLSPDKQKKKLIDNKKKLPEKQVLRQVPSPKKENKSGKTPKIILNQGALLYHKLGEPFFEPGATATDFEGNRLDVDILGEVDINKINRYVLTYVATDKNGNSTIETRVVMVYKAGMESKKNLENIHPKETKYKTKLEQDGVGGAEDFPLPIDEIEELFPLESLD